MKRSEPGLVNTAWMIHSAKEDCWLGHVIRMDQQRIPQQALYWEVPRFKRAPGRLQSAYQLEEHSQQGLVKDGTYLGGSRGGSSK